MWTTVLIPLFLLSGLRPTGVQHPAVIPQDFVFVNPGDVPALPEIRFELIDMIDVLTDYSIIDEDSPTFCRQYWGMTDFHTRTISVCSRADLTMRRQTVIHETLHVIYWRMGINTGGQYEPVIEAQARKIFLRLYGPKTQVPAPETAKIP